MPYCIRPGCVGTCASADYAGFTHGGNFRDISIYVSQVVHVAGNTTDIPTGAVRLNTGYAEQNSMFAGYVVVVGLFHGHGGQSATLQTIAVDVVGKVVQAVPD